MFLASEKKRRILHENNNLLQKLRAHVNIFTCTVCQTAGTWSHKLIDIIPSWTGFDFNGIGLEVAAVIAPVTADISSDYSILNCWMSSVQPQWSMSATTQHINTCVWHLNALTLNVETVPAVPADRSVTHYLRGMLIVGGSPQIIQDIVVVAGVNRGSCC